MADQWVASGERGWKSDFPGRGGWNIPEAQMALLPDDMSGMLAIELGGVAPVMWRDGLPGQGRKSWASINRKSSSPRRNGSPPSTIFRSRWR